MKPFDTYPKGVMSRLFQWGSVAAGVCLMETGEVCLLLPAGANQKICPASTTDSAASAPIHVNAFWTSS